MPAALESPSGMLEMKMAATVTTLTPAPASRLRPIATESGMPSGRAPTAMAAPLPSASLSDGCRPPERFRCFAPYRLRHPLAAL